MDSDALPLSGVRVLDFTHVLAGPFCTYQLAVLGADVIKIESADCMDMMRFSGPDYDLAAQNMGLHYQSQASNKRSLALDLKHPETVKVLDKLIDTADVLVVNYRKEAAKRLKIDYDRVSKINPKIVYCSLTGFGTTGPKADHPAYDNVIQAFSGLMAATGSAESGAMRVGPPVLDYGSGAQAALSVMSSLFMRERTGKGNFIDVAMLDAALMLMTSAVTEVKKTGNAPVRPGNRSAKAGYGCYECKEGDIMIGAYTRQQTVNLWQALGHPDKAQSVAVLDQLKLDDAHDEDTRLLTERFLTRTATEWESLLIDADVPAARLRSLEQTLQEPQVQARATVQSVATRSTENNPTITGAVPVAAWQSLYGSPHTFMPPPTVGEHSEEILKELGLSEQEVIIQREQGVIT